MGTASKKLCTKVGPSEDESWSVAAPITDDPLLRGRRQQCWREVRAVSHIFARCVGSPSAPSATAAVRRQYLEKHLVPFAEANPQIQMAVCTRPNRHPFIQGWYVRDPSKTLSLKNLSPEQVIERITFLRDVRPVGLRKDAKPFRTSPSVQGEWSFGHILDTPHRTLRG